MDVKLCFVPYLPWCYLQILFYINILLIHTLVTILLVMWLIFPSWIDLSQKITDAKILKQQLFLSICWYFDVGAHELKFGCDVVLSDPVGTEKIEASVSGCPAT